MVRVKLYVEGGGDSNSLHYTCREAFRIFLQRAGFEGNMPRIVACGSRQAAFNDFRTACSKPREKALLLVDSETRVTTRFPWEHLTTQPDESIIKPPQAQDDQCHLMVVCMESWFLADKESLSDFFGQGFNINALPQSQEIESIPKNDVYKGLQAAIIACKTKGKNSYDKGKHSFAILKCIDPVKVRSASSWADRFMDTLEQYMGSRKRR